MVRQEATPVRARLNHMSSSSRDDRPVYRSGFEINTGVSNLHTVPVHDGLNAHLTLEQNSFQFLRKSSVVQNLRADVLGLDTAKMLNALEIADVCG